MWRTGEWVVPRLAGEFFLEKPPLYFWFCGACGNWFGSLFGIDRVGASRLSCSICALGAIAAAAWMAFLLHGRRRDALFAALVLATMPQFLVEMHWMRTDVLLAFCVVSSSAFLVLAYRLDRPWALLPAGLAATGAFLSKGPIGWILVAAAALPLALQAFLANRGNAPGGERPSLVTRRWFFAHVGGALLAIIPAGLWVLAIYLRDNPSAWNAWFWDNQVGRTTGSATALGHHNPWAIHYYIVLLPVVLGPWTPHLVLWLRERIRVLRSVPVRTRWRELISSPAFFLVAWGFGGLLLLTIPSTKRGVYLLPLYPAFALMAADAIPLATHRFFRIWTVIWEILAVILAAAILLLPAIVHLGLPPDWFINSCDVLLVHWTCYHTFTLLLALLYLVLRRPFCAARDAVSPALRLFLANAFLWLTVFAVPFQTIDAAKSMRGATLRFAAELPDDTSRTVAFRLDETARAVLEYYAGVVLAPAGISPYAPHEEASEYVAGILAGKRPGISSVVAQARRDRDKVWPPEAEVTHATLGGKRHLYLLAPSFENSR